VVSVVDAARQHGSGRAADTRCAGDCGHQRRQQHTSGDSKPVDGEGGESPTAASPLGAKPLAALLPYIGVCLIGGRRRYEGLGSIAGALPTRKVPAEASRDGPPNASTAEDCRHGLINILGVSGSTEKEGSGFSGHVTLAASHDVSETPDFTLLGCVGNVAAGRDFSGNS
jgi:hypothetical protein